MIHMLQPQELEEKENSFRSGFVAIIGLPNAGKSTLLNEILQRKVSIISPKPQTTRNKIIGVKHMSDAQLIFLDTPGVAIPRTKLNKAMQAEVLQSIEGSELILLMVEVAREPLLEQIKPLELIKGRTPPVFLVINKIDRVRKDKLLDIINAYRKLANFAEIIPISALKRVNVDRLLGLIRCYLPAGPRYFPKEMVTDRPETFMMAEIIREKVSLFTQQELPHTSAVMIDSVSQGRGERDLVLVEASILVEKESQKAIIIGRGGRMIKKIGAAARLELELTAGTGIYLKLRVAVKKGWTESDRLLKELGYIG